MLYVAVPVMKASGATSLICTSVEVIIMNQDGGEIQNAKSSMVNPIDLDL